MVRVKKPSRTPSKGEKKIQTRSDVINKVNDTNKIQKKEPKKGKSLKTQPGLSQLPSHGNIKKPHRFKPGTVALREIRKQVQSTEDLIPKACFQRLVRSMTAELPYNQELIKNDTKNGDNDDKTDINLIRFGKGSIDAIKAAAEAYLIRLFRQTNKAALHAGRPTIFPKDMRLWTEGVDRIKLTDFPETIITPRKRVKKENTKKKTKKSESTGKKEEGDDEMQEDKSTENVQNNGINNNNDNNNLNFKNFI